ncbi:putative fatty acyl-CoA reductase CG5065 [Chironomus tepperi]|uniref:putative fatty acyl-CoA reductase CG5065 n=1 Tax=Chironomus tepperi TaxID=113505 RepID=UPI00391EEB27
MIKFENSPTARLKTDEEILETLFAKEERLENYPTIPEFYNDQEIFITGGSGFIGKVLIEKLLRSCPGIKAIYILMRPKKGKDIAERLKVITDLELFEPLRQNNPELFTKLVPVAGDVTELQLGLSKNDLDRMKNVSVIFHSAASVRFDDSLKYAIMMNTRGTREIMRFAETLKNIKVVMHVSTTYSNPHLRTVEEQVHQAPVDWRTAIDICENANEDHLNSLTQHYTKFMPNTYVFSKSLAEHVTDDYKEKLPVVIFRPSIVISAIKEPLPGWVDNFNGPVGLLVGSGIGIVRTMYSNPDNRCDFLPVDVCVKGMIIAAWKKGMEHDNSIPVYNCASYNVATLKIQQIIDIGKCLCAVTPLDNMLFIPGGHITNSRYSNYVKVIFYQLLPALIIDGILKLKGHKTFMTKIQRKIYEANLALRYFVMNEWIFKNDNFLTLCDKIKLEDLKEFDYRDCFNHDVIMYMRIAMRGVRKYLIHDNLENDERNRMKYKFLNVIHTLLCSVPYILLYFVLKILIFDKFWPQ